MTIYIVQLKGKKGDQGEKGPKGDKGEKGEKGTSACQGRHGCQCHSSCQEMITVISFPICLYFFIFSPSFYHLVQSKYLGVRVYVMASFFFLGGGGEFSFGFFYLGGKMFLISPLDGFEIQTGPYGQTRLTRTVS